MGDLSFYLIVLGLIGLLIVAPVRGSRWISRRYGRRHSHAFRLFIIALMIALVTITWLSVAASVRNGGWTAAILTPFIMLVYAIPVVAGVTLLWMGTLWAWERLRS